MSQQAYLQSLSDAARKEYLTSICTKADTGKYMKPLTDEEIANGKDTLTENWFKLGDLEAELSEIKKSYKDKMDPLQTANKMILGEIRVKQRVATGTLYHVANHDSGWMETYDEEGELMGTRKLRPDERQGGLFPMAIAQ